MSYVGKGYWWVDIREGKKEVVWEIISRYWRRENIRTRKDRRDKIVLFVLSGLANLGQLGLLGENEVVDKTLRLLEKAIKEA